MKIAVVGATGLVGREMLTVLAERGFGKEEIIAAASPKSVGKTIEFADRQLTVVSVEEAIAAIPDYAIFSAGASASRQYAPLFAAKGTVVIDNSSAWRKDADKPLVVPEINIDAVKPTDRIIANPNCSTIQMVLALSSLEREYGIRRIVVSTYQSITGTGIKAVRQLEAEEHGEQPTEMAYSYPIHRNLFPMAVTGSTAGTPPRSRNSSMRPARFSPIPTSWSPPLWHACPWWADTASRSTWNSGKNMIWTRCADS